MPEERFIFAPIYVFWDFENCGLPTTLHDPHLVRANILKTLRANGYHGELVKVKAYGDVKGIPKNYHSDVYNGGICLRYVPQRGVKEGADKKLLSVMVKWAEKRKLQKSTDPVNVLLISSDGDFSHFLHELNNAGHNILIASQYRTTEALRSAASQTFNWFDMVNPGREKSSDSLTRSESQNETSNQDFTKEEKLGAVLECLKYFEQEKIVPTEEAIKCCIKHVGSDKKKRARVGVSEVLTDGVKQRRIVERRGFYKGAEQRWWHPVFPMADDTDKFGLAIWQPVEDFLASDLGRNQYKASENEFHAAMILQKNCFASNPLNLGTITQLVDLAERTKHLFSNPNVGTWKPAFVSAPIGDKNTTRGT